MNQGELRVLASVSAHNADDQTLRLCASEEEAIAVSLRLSGCHQNEVARRMGISPAYLTLLKQGQRTLTAENRGKATVKRFIEATGWNLVRQYRALQSALRAAQGRPREMDRIAYIASFSEAA